jgi:hypothetical protein
VLLFALAVLPVGLIVWLTLVRPRRQLPEDTLCCLRGVVLTEIVAVKDDVLAGYRGGTGSWFTVDPADATGVRVTAGLRDAEGQFFLPAVVLDTRAMKLLYAWCEEQTRLVSAVCGHPPVIRLTDASPSHAVVAELEARRPPGGSAR